MGRLGRNWLVAALIGMLSAAAATAMAQQAPIVADPARPRVAITRHTGIYNGQTVRYSATVAEHFLKDDSGEPAATVTTIAYVRDNVSDVARRPVLFLFNGGPGASSSPLHMTAMGPVRRIGGPNSREPAWERNPYSPIDVFDLVFIDPVGTGFQPRAGGQGRKEVVQRLR